LRGGPRGRVPAASENANSVVLRFRLGKFEFLETGDLPGSLEEELACPADRVGQVDLFLAMHHGTALSNLPTFLRTIAPTAVVVNNGPRKGGDPTTMARLKTIPSIRAAYQLHKNVSTDQAVNVPP
jgi:competence protein ComEC